MIRNIVFDIGGVLADFRIREFMMDKGLQGPVIKRILQASVMNPFWGKFERGEVTEEEALRAFTEADPEIAEELRLAYTDLSGMLTMRPFAIPLVRGLKEAGYGVYYLSNYSRKAYEECAESLAFMPYMDGGLVSFRAGKTKPSPDMYRLFLDTCGLKAGECLFVDDTKENVRAAEALGFTGLVFTSFDRLMDDLGRLGVLAGEGPEKAEG